MVKFSVKMDSLHVSGDIAGAVELINSNRGLVAAQLAAQWVASEAGFLEGSEPARETIVAVKNDLILAGANVWCLDVLFYVEHFLKINRQEQYLI